MGRTDATVVDASPRGHSNSFSLIWKWSEVRIERKLGIWVLRKLSRKEV